MRPILLMLALVTSVFAADKGKDITPLLTSASWQWQHPIAKGIRTLKFKDRSATGVILIGDTEEAAVVNGLNLSEGRFLSGAEVDGARPVCVIGCAASHP